MLYFLVLLCGVYIGGCICAYLEVWLTNVDTGHHPAVTCLAWPFSLVAVLALRDKATIREKLGWASVPDHLQALEAIRAGRQIHEQYGELLENHAMLSRQCSSLSLQNIQLFGMLSCGACYAREREPCNQCIEKIAAITNLMGAVGYQDLPPMPPPESP